MMQGVQEEDTSEERKGFGIFNSIDDPKSSDSPEPKSSSNGIGIFDSNNGLPRSHDSMV